MARRKGNGKHAAKHQDMPVTANTYSRDNYGSQARLRYSSNSGSRRSRKNPWRVVFVVSLCCFDCPLLFGLGAIAFSIYFAAACLWWSGAICFTVRFWNVALADLTVDWDALRAVNPDIVAWVYVPDSPINYPVVQGDDNEEYLHKAFWWGLRGWLASAGTIF